MNKPVFYIILFLCFGLHAQKNLVFNGDFEEYSACPQAESSPFQNPKEIEKCLGWKAPTYGTSDYFNVCASNPIISVPINALGVQNPYNGSGYLGGFASSFTGGAGDDGYSGIMWWEYIQGQLIEPLEKGKIYHLSLQISLAEYSDLMITEIGAHFSANPISSPNTASLPLDPQCKFTNTDFYRDTLNWVKVESIFMAVGGEKFITIGNFRNNLETDTLRRYNYGPLIINPYVTYFYYDAVELTDVTDNYQFSNLLTPNGDGINDFWFIPAFNENESITILNRWGTVIRDEKLSGFKWDGKSTDGKECTEGTYFYLLSETKKTGFIQLVK